MQNPTIKWTDRDRYEYGEEQFEELRMRQLARRPPRPQCPCGGNIGVKEVDGKLLCYICRGKLAEQQEDES